MDLEENTPLVSLIVATLGRESELRQLLNSISNGDYKNLEVIIVDQNKDDRLNAVVSDYNTTLDIVHCKVNFIGASKARNYGASQAKGKYLNFPDDDSFFAPDTISRAVRFLNAEMSASAVSGQARSPDNQESIINYVSGPCQVAFDNIQNTTIEFSVFWRTSQFNELSGFDSELGVGTYYSSEESADLIIRALQRKFLIYYEPGIKLFHPANRDQPIKKFYRYARGTGRLVYKHRSNAVVRRFGLMIVLKSVVGFIIYIPFTRKSSRYLARALGFFVGYIRSMYGYSV